MVIGGLLVGLGAAGCAQAVRPAAAPGVEAGPAGQVVRRVAVPGNPDGLSVGGHELWVGTYQGGSVAEIDIRTGALVRTVPVGVTSFPLSVHASGSTVWVGAYGSASVLRVDSTTGKVADTIAVGAAPVGFADLDGQLWVVNQADSTISVIDPARRRVARTLPVEGLRGGFPVSYGGAVWVADLAGATNELWRVDPTTGHITTRVPTGPNPSEVAFGFGSGWVTDAEGLTRFDPATGAVQRRITGLGRKLDGIAVGPDAVWVGSIGDNQVSRVDPRRNQATGRVTGLQAPRQIVVVDGQVWVAEFTGNTVAQITPGPAPGLPPVGRAGGLTSGG
jgi:DNA-binding beta-propeller fold protein YncE